MLVQCCKCGNIGPFWDYYSYGSTDMICVRCNYKWPYEDPDWARIEEVNDVGILL